MNKIKSRKKYSIHILYINRDKRWGEAEMNLNRQKSWSSVTTSLKSGKLCILQRNTIFLLEILNNEAFCFIVIKGKPKHTNNKIKDLDYLY